MRHARDDYNRIQDPAGLIPDDEPVFLIRGKDRAAVHAVRQWAREAEALGADPEIVKAARNQALLMLMYQKEHGSKVPDAPAGAV